MIDPLVAWLEQCSVRIVGDRSGTGFFVSPGRILTCAHVVGVQRAVGSGGIQVLWGELVDEDAQVAGIWPDPDDDLAILNVALSDHPCARLGTGAALDDELYACGFPNYGAGAQGDGLSGTLESLTRLSGAGPDRRFIKFKGADVVPGFSGGPLLDRRTGEVIGIVTETRGSGSGLGGWAIPVEFAFTCIPRLVDENRSFHARDPRWEANWREHLRLGVEREEQRRARLAGLDAGLPSAIAIDNFLAHYLGSPQAPEPFGGRGDVLRQLGAWLEDTRAAPYLLVLAPAGRGKSALLVRWYDELSRQADAMEPPLELIFIPVSLRYELSSEAAVFGALAARLSRLHGSALPPPGLAGAALRDLASALLCRPLPSGKRLLVLVDGLDEAVGWDAGPASFPQTPAAGVRAVFSARLTASRATAAAWLDRMGWRPDHAAAMLLDPLERAGVQDVLERMGAPFAELAGKGPLVTELYRLTGGDPLLLCLYSRDLWARGDQATRLSPSQLSGINPGIEGYFDRWWKDQQVQWGEGLANKKETVQIVFNLLATALGPLPRRDLLRLARTISAVTGDALDDVLETLGRFVVCDSARQAYVLAHPRFAQYRYDKLAADGEEQSYERLFLDWGSETLETAARDGDLSGLSPYIVQRYGAHLERSRRPAAERLRLVSSTWRRAWESHGEEHGGFLSDIESAWRAAAETDQAAVAAGEPPPFVEDELRCALFTAEASAAVELTDASLLSALAAQGVWSAGRCLSFALRLDPGRQAEALAALVPHLERMHVAPVVAAVDRLFDPYFPDGCAPLIAALAVRFLELGDPARALELARLRPGYARGAAMIALVPHLPPEARTVVLGEALDDAGSYEQGFLFAKLVDLLASRVDRHALQDGSAFGDRFIALLDLEQASGEHQAWRVAFAAPWLEGSERRRRLREVVDRLAARVGQRRPWEIFMTSEIVDLAAALDPELAEEVLARCVDRYSDDMKGYQARSLIVLLPRLPVARQEEVAQRILAAAPEAARLGGIEDRVDFFARLAAAGYGDRALEVIGEQKPGDWYTQDLIEGVVPFLDERQTRVCLELAERCRPETRARARSAVLGRLASFGREQAREVLALCHRGDNPGEEEAVALLLLDLFGGRETAAPDVFRILAGNEDGNLRLSAMVQVAAFFDPLDAEAFEIAVSSFGDTVRSVLAVEAIGCLAPYLAPAAVTDERVIGAVRRPVESVGHGRKEVHLVPYFQRLAALGRVREGLSIGCRLATSRFELPLFCALVGLAGACEGEELRMALEKAGAIEDKDYRVLALLALSPRAEEDRRQSLVQEAADHLASFDVGYLGLMSGKIAVVLGVLSEPIRRRILGLIVTDELLRSGSRLAADAQVRLLPFLPEEQVDRLRHAGALHESGTDQSRLSAALAARVAAFGHSEEGLELCRTLSGEHLIAALTAILAVLPPDLLPAALDPAFRLPGYLRVRLGPAFASRWKDLSRRQLLEVVQAWLRRVSRTNRSDLLFDLVLFGWPLHRLGGQRAVSSVVKLLQRE